MENKNSLGIDEFTRITINYILLIFRYLLYVSDIMDNEKNVSKGKRVEKH